ncbi:hypothetical protein [Anaeromyxobacter diazotrophicus]|uniref:Uncharacterized protein n=1 Tax=Anaeromyxobacter diazotrophicus TaxID=2590199 RepID=A0A7I9VLP7_9BACT|nr:hypothetical protein [Anaeromyxobacter diazotrophicus]GEJ57332.1 hypothetical protein AMYX_20730 [Anaeromyxobacter diazotrophicus]
MLDAFIIEEIKRQERERAADDRPVVQLPVPEPPAPAHHDDDRPGDGGGGGVVIIDYAG